MKSMRRYHIHGASYSFVTVITYAREPLLLIEPELFFKCWSAPGLEAWVVLPDHFHVIVRLYGRTISDIMHSFKTKYSRRFRDKYRPGRVWQNRFWDHIIRDSDDLHRYLDYIHFNPVKHGLAASAADYGPSSFHKFVRSGQYELGWGGLEDVEDEGYGE